MTPQQQTATFRWMAGIMVTIILALAGEWGITMTRSIEILSHDLRAHVIEQSAQINSITNKVSMMGGTLQQNGVRLERIETNQDLVLRSLSRR